MIRLVRLGINKKIGVFFSKFRSILLLCGCFFVFELISRGFWYEFIEGGIGFGIWKYLFTNWLFKKLSFI